MVLFAGLFVLVSIPLCLIVERRGSAWMQRRTGPNRVGPWGVLQTVADAIKLVFKEENIPAQSHKVLFTLAPALGVLPPFLAFAVIPFAGSILWQGNEYFVQVSNLNVSLLFLLAITSLHVYSVLAAGWASNNKFSLMGALRSSSQMISYEIAIGITIVSMVMTYGTLDLREIVKMQAADGALPAWGFALQPVAFLTLWVSSFAETNRLPFDLPEGESELVAGYHTEYSGLKFALFFLAEYASMLLSSAFLATLFLGGYNVPFVSEIHLREFYSGFGLTTDLASIFCVLTQLMSFVAKIWFFMWIFVWVRWTLPRFRYDQLMDLGWKVMLPIGVLNVIATMLVTFYLRARG
jgi:NADH-quinone oxidoreductase subunit H